MKSSAKLSNLRRDLHICYRLNHEQQLIFSELYYEIKDMENTIQRNTGEKLVRTKCCGAPICYKEIKEPLGDGIMPFNILILWCQKCGQILDGNGNFREPNIKITEL